MRLLKRRNLQPGEFSYWEEEVAKVESSGLRALDLGIGADLAAAAGVSIKYMGRVVASIEAHIPQGFNKIIIHMPNGDDVEAYALRIKDRIEVATRNPIGMTDQAFATKWRHYCDLID